MRIALTVPDRRTSSVLRAAAAVATKKEAVNFALRALAAEPMPVERARAMRGSGWEGDLNDLRGTRTA